MIIGVKVKFHVLGVLGGLGPIWGFPKLIGESLEFMRINRMLACCGSYRDTPVSGDDHVGFTAFGTGSKVDGLGPKV